MNYLKKYKEIITFAFLGAVLGYFILSPFAMVVSDFMHSKMLAEEKVHAMYANPWASVLEVFKPYLLVWSLIFTVFSGIIGYVIGSYLKKKRELEQLKDSLTHMIIHDLNNPLSVILVSVEHLERIVNSPAGHRALIAAKDRIWKMKNMISNLLDISRMEENKFQPACEKVKLDLLIREELDSLNIAAKKEGKTVSFIAKTEEQEIDADLDLLRRVILNLIDNALKFTPAGSKVEIVREYNPDTDSLIVKVKDSGPGIDQEDQGRIFDKFSQARSLRAKLGYGLGLTFCKMAVEALGGKIWVESQIGKGSTFSFSLPLHSPSP